MYLLTARANASRSSSPPSVRAAAAAAVALAATGATLPSAMRLRRSRLPSTAVSNCGRWSGVVQGWEVEPQQLSSYALHGTSPRPLHAQQHGDKKKGVGEGRTEE